MRVLNIESDYRRFRDIVRGKIKKELRKFLTNSELIGKQGKNTVSIPIPNIEIPKIIYGDKEQSGVGSGDGQVGDPADGQNDSGTEKAGDQPGDHTLEMDLTIEELASILGEELELPRIQPKGIKSIYAEKEKYTGIHRAGPMSLRHFKRTYKQSLKRQIMSGSYNPLSPTIIPFKEDFRFRSWKKSRIPQSNAVIIYMMDVSGSMGDEQKEIVRIEAFWLNTWLKSQYKGVHTRYIIHDAAAKEVDEEVFFKTRESGGTIISSAYKECLNVITKEYRPEDWNIYAFHFSDGDNWSPDDTALCINLLKEQLLPKLNLFCYGQVDSQYGTGQFIKDLETVKDVDNLAISRILSKEGIYNSIKDFLGKGK